MAEKEFTFKARITRRNTVVVWADSAEEALKKFEAGDWEEDGGGENVDWEATSRPVQSDD